MFGRRRRMRGHEHACYCPDGKTPPCSLAECPESARVRVLANPDRQTLELGLYPGAMVRVMRNHHGDPNLVVGFGDSRFILVRAIADSILVG